MMNRATNLMPSQLAGAIPVRRTGTFKEKIDAPALEELASHSNLLLRRKHSLNPWTPEGPKPNNGPIKLPPTSDRIELSGNAAIAVYVTDENRITTWDAVEGKPLGILALATKPTPVVNFDGSVVAGALVVSSVTERINAGHARFPNPSAIYSTAGTFLTRLDLATCDVTKWSITNRQVTLNSWSLSADESLAVASADGRKYGWVLNLKDGSSRELSPAAWPDD